MDNAKFNPILEAIATVQSNGIHFWEGKNFTIQRIYGGANNALFNIETKNETFACKLCVEDGRDRAVREYYALKTIQTAGADIAPIPILLDESKLKVEYPVVIYRWVAGQILGSDVSQRQLETFLSSYLQLHRIKFSNYQPFKLNAWFHWFNFDDYLVEIRELFDLYTPWLESELPAGAHLRERLNRIIRECSQIIYASDVDPDKENIPLRLVRVDPNTSNAILGPKGEIRWVDWEYSGWGDPALDIAELRWHAALQPLGETALKWLRANYTPPPGDPNFWQRVQIWDGILAARWPLLILRALWSNHNGPDRERLSAVVQSSKTLVQNLENHINRTEKFFSQELNHNRR